MIRTLGYHGVDAGRQLLDLYKDDPHVVLWAVASSLARLPKEGPFDSAFRDLAKPDTLATMYGAVLTDIRDFLKLRFRVKGPTESPISPASILRDFGSGSLDEREELIRLDWVVNYVISALDGLSREREILAEVLDAIRVLKDVCRSSAMALNAYGEALDLWPEADNVGASPDEEHL